MAQTEGLKFRPIKVSKVRRGRLFWASLSSSPCLEENFQPKKPSISIDKKKPPLAFPLMQAGTSMLYIKGMLIQYALPLNTYFKPLINFSVLSTTVGCLSKDESVFVTARALSVLIFPRIYSSSL